MPQVRYNKKWHDVKGIEKCDEGFNYQLDGIEGKVYSRDVEDVRMKKEETHEIVNPDGSIVRGPGKEPLRKPMKKSLQERWELLKAQISHSDAFMSMEDEGDEDQQQAQDPTQQDPAQQDPTQQDPTQQDLAQALAAQIQDPDAQDPSDAVDVSQLEGAGDVVPTGDEDGRQDPDDDAQDDSGQPEGGEGAEVDEAADSNTLSEYDEEKLIELLRQEGYSDPEIAHIVHGHVPGQQAPEAKAMDVEQQREQEKHEHHMDRTKSDSDIKLEHARRMADLEHDHAKREKEIRLKYLEEELKARIENVKNKG